AAQQRSPHRARRRRQRSSERRRAPHSAGVRPRDGRVDGRRQDGYRTHAAHADGAFTRPRTRGRRQPLRRPRHRPDERRAVQRRLNDPDEHGFGGVLAGTTSGVKTAVFTNTGKQALTVSTVTIPDSSVYTIVPGSDECSEQTIAADGGTCQIGVRFAPTAAGSRSATLTVADDSTAAGSTTATLNGVGTTTDPPPGGNPAPAGGGAGAAAGAAAGAPAGSAVLGTKASSGSSSKAK